MYFVQSVEIPEPQWPRHPERAAACIALQCLSDEQSMIYRICSRSFRVDESVTELTLMTRDMHCGFGVC